MFSDFFDSEYETSRFLFKGTQEQIEKFKNDEEYDVEVLSEEILDNGKVVVEVSKYTWVTELIPKYPELMATGFVEEWGEYKDVYVAFSASGSEEIDACERVGYFDGHNDINWHDSCPITAMNHDVEMGYSGEYETVTYDFPFFFQWKED